MFQMGYLGHGLVLMALQYLNLYNTINWIPYRRHELAVVSSCCLLLVTLLEFIVPMFGCCAVLPKD